MRLTRGKLKAVTLLLIILTLAFIWSNSMQPKAKSTDSSMKLLDTIAEILEPVGIKIDTSNDRPIRKFAHFAEFSLLGAELYALMLLCGMKGLQGIINSLFCGLLTAVTDEFIQIFSHRGSSVADVMLDFSGIITAIIIINLLNRIRISK